MVRTHALREWLLVLSSVCIFSAAVFGQREEHPAPNADEEISLNMPRIGVVDALRMLGKLTDTDLVIHPDVSGVIDLFMQDVSVEEAWKSVLDSANLSVSQDGGVFKVEPKPEELPPQVPREVRVIKLKYISLGQMVLSGGLTQQGVGGQNNASVNPLQQSSTQQEDEEELDEILQGAFEDAITVFKDVRTNHLILSGEAEVLDRAEAVINRLDQPISQILIEAQVIQIRTQAMKDLGIDWGGVYTLQNTGQVTLDSSRLRTDPGGVVSETLSEDAGFTTTLTGFNVVLSALIDGGDAQVLFKPRVVTQNNKEAYISSGSEIQIPSGLDINGNATFRERQVVLELGVTPQVMANDLISLSIRVKNDSINFAQPDISGVPPLDVNSIESFVTLRDRDTVIIGGILTTQNSRNQRRIPFLSDIPVLGKAFQSRSNRFEQSELLLVITPRIISDAFGFIDYAASGEVYPTASQQRWMEQMSEPSALNFERESNQQTPKAKRHY